MSFIVTGRSVQLFRLRRYWRLQLQLRVPGCAIDELQCTPTDFYTCSNENIWQHGTLLPLSCVFDIPPEDDIPIRKACAACSGVEPVDLCLAKEPQSGANCIGYNFDYTGCTSGELQCTWTSMYTCSKYNGWEVALFADPKPCPKKVCPYKTPTSEYCIDYEEGLNCEYEFRYTGCNKDK